MTTQITLSETESQILASLSESRGVTPEEILHQAIEQFLAQQQTKSRLAALRQARGIWRDREDAPDVAALRSEWGG